MALTYRRTSTRGQSLRRENQSRSGERHLDREKRESRRSEWPMWPDDSHQDPNNSLSRPSHRLPRIASLGRHRDRGSSHGLLPPRKPAPTATTASPALFNTLIFVFIVVLETIR